jgi:hypothetical protein
MPGTRPGSQSKCARPKVESAARHPPPKLARPRRGGDPARLRYNGVERADQDGLRDSPRLALRRAEDVEERLLREVDRADALHPLLALLLVVQVLHLALIVPCRRDAPSAQCPFTDCTASPPYRPARRKKEMRLSATPHAGCGQRRTHRSRPREARRASRARQSSCPPPPGLGPRTAGAGSPCLLRPVSGRWRVRARKRARTQLLHPRLPDVLLRGAVDDERERIDGLAVQEEHHLCHRQRPPASA